MENFNIIKKDGSTEKLDISKIQKMADFVCRGTKCGSLDLQTSMHCNLHDGIKTDFIHKQMTNEAINKIGKEDESYSNGPDWRIVAGRLKLMEILKEKRALGLKEKIDIGLDGDLNFSDFIEYHIRNNLYDKNHFKKFTKSELNELWNDIGKPAISRNFDYFIESIITLENKFLLGLENPQHLYFVISLIYTQAYFKKRKIKIKNRLNGKKELTQQFKNKLSEIFEEASGRKISFPSVILSELRKPKANLASCFIGKFPDNLDGIMDLIKDFATISKKGGGIGVNMDSIRAFKSWLMGVKGNATGVVPLLKLLNDLAIYANQSGIKPGAITPSLSFWHMDIFNFLQTQQLGGEEREKAMDLFLQVVANDKFMEILEANKDWYTFDPYEIEKKFGINLGKVFGDEFSKQYDFLVEEADKGNLELFKIIRARDLFKESLRTSINRGTPYWFFKDNVNKVSNMKDAGTIYSGNLCVESYSIFDDENTHTCNLLSLVHPFITDLKHTTRVAIEILDLTIDLSTPPTKQSKKHNNSIRAIGLGSMGLADWAAMNSASYSTKQGHDRISKLFERVAYYSIERSHELGIELGSFPRFNESEWKKGNIFGKVLTEIKFRSLDKDLDWDSLSHKCTLAMRNGWLLAIAPNTSSSSAIGVSSSILPIFNKHFIEETKSGNIPRMPLYINERPLGYTEYKHIPKEDMNTCVSNIQFWTDGGISYEQVFDLNDPKNTKTETIMNFYIDAWKKGIKAIYYIRWIKPGTDKMAEKNECIGCAG